MTDNYLTILAKANCLSLEDRTRLFKDLLDLTETETRINLLVSLFLFCGSKDVKTALKISKTIENLRLVSNELENLELNGLPTLQTALKALSN